MVQPPLAVQLFIATGGNLVPFRREPMVHAYEIASDEFLHSLKVEIACTKFRDCLDPSAEWCSEFFKNNASWNPQSHEGCDDFKNDVSGGVLWNFMKSGDRELFGFRSNLMPITGSLLGLLQTRNFWIRLLTKKPWFCVFRIR